MQLLLGVVPWHIVLWYVVVTSRDATTLVDPVARVVGLRGESDPRPPGDPGSAERRALMRDGFRSAYACGLTHGGSVLATVAG